MNMLQQNSNAGATQQVASQYHHFIPRFILKNFAHSYRPKISKSRNRSKKGAKPPRPGDAMLYTIDLAGKGDVVEAPLAKSFGITDMYRDFGAAGNQHLLEEKLARLESDAGRIIATIRKEYEAGGKEVWMIRKDRDTLRKFLFIMKYRSSGFHRRFQHRTVEEYRADDKELLVKYMREKGFTCPMDVWFDNIKAILDLKMEPGLDWAKELLQRMYPPDAAWAFTNIQAMYLAMCTPMNQTEEFLLSENLFSIHEGPVSLEIDVRSGEEVPTAYTEYHVFAVISPRVILVLRSTLLPNAEEDMNVEAKRSRELWDNMNRSMHRNPAKANSVLEDLPVRKANNSYTQIIGGKRCLLRGEDGSPRAHHKFGFQFFAIETRHVNIINSVILEQAHTITTLCFHSQQAARKTLEWYLTTTSDTLGCHALKKFNGPADPRIACIRKLECAARSLGSAATASYVFTDYEREEQEFWDQFGPMLSGAMSGAIDDDPQGFAASYLKLGGTGATLIYDMEQTRKMLYLRIKIDVWSQNLEENVRVKIRNNLIDLFCQLLPRRFYLFMKRVKYMLLERYFEDQCLQVGASQAALSQGPEDAIAQSSQLIRRDRITKLLYHAVMNDVESTKHQFLDITAEVLPEAEKAFRTLRLRVSLFDRAGSICNCGIDIIEAKAREARHVVDSSPMFHQFSNPMLSNEQNTELRTRILIKADFLDLMDGNRPSNELESLEEALFGTLYLTKFWE